jgi:hypothetical protein
MLPSNAPDTQLLVAAAATATAVVSGHPVLPHSDSIKWRAAGAGTTFFAWLRELSNSCL